VLGWLLFPLRYLDLLWINSSRAGRIGNHCYLWVKKREDAGRESAPPRSAGY
jgi:hypothetical protein